MCNMTRRATRNQFNLNELTLMTLMFSNEMENKRQEKHTFCTHCVICSMYYVVIYRKSGKRYEKLELMSIFVYVVRHLVLRDGIQPIKSS